MNNKDGFIKQTLRQISKTYKYSNEIQYDTTLLIRQADTFYVSLQGETLKYTG